MITFRGFSFIYFLCKEIYWKTAILCTVMKYFQNMNEKEFLFAGINFRFRMLFDQEKSIFHVNDIIMFLFRFYLDIILTTESFSYLQYVSSGREDLGFSFAQMTVEALNK